MQPVWRAGVPSTCRNVEHLTRLCCRTQKALRESLMWIATQWPNNGTSTLFHERRNAKNAEGSKDDFQLLWRSSSRRLKFLIKESIQAVRVLGVFSFFTVASKAGEISPARMRDVRTCCVSVEYKVWWWFLCEITALWTNKKRALFSSGKRTVEWRKDEI